VSIVDTFLVNVSFIFGVYNLHISDLGIFLHWLPMGEARGGVLPGVVESGVVLCREYMHVQNTQSFYKRLIKRHVKN
jgi:hypothetical protein